MALQQDSANSCGIIDSVSESDGIKRLRELVAIRNKASADVDAFLAGLLREGEYVESLAAAMEVSRETIRRFRDDRGIPDTREIRAAKGEPRRRPRGD
jgi:hypothetical protein